MTVVDRYSRPFDAIYDSRPFFAARSGGLSADHDLDNVEVQFMDSTQNILHFGAVSQDAIESAADVTVTVVRRGNAAEPATVAYATMDGTATGNSDYRPAAGMLSFGPGEMEKSFNVELFDDESDEGDEIVLLSLHTASGAVLGGP